MPDFSAPNSLPSNFVQAAKPAAPQATATIQIDKDVLQWFQQQGANWQSEMSAALRSVMEDVQAMDRAAPLELDDSYEAARQEALDALTNRHQDEYEDVHNGSGRSEEFPSDLDARHAEEQQRFESQWPAQPAPAGPKPPGL